MAEEPDFRSLAIRRTPAGQYSLGDDANDWLRSAPCQRVFDALEAAGASARAVGGSIRNALIGQAVADVDIATTALPEEVMSLCGEAGLAVHPTGLVHGTVTVVSNGVPFEVTTLRRDVETDGRRATVAYTTDWAEDASRRDFTMNALYCDRDGVLFDPTGQGLSDLSHRHVRFIGDPEQRIREDYLRSLRFFRFFASYADAKPDSEGLAAVKRLREGVRSLSAERVHSELLKLLMAPRAVSALSEMNNIGVAEIVLQRRPDIAALRKLESMEIASDTPSNAIRRLAAIAAQDEDAARRTALHLKLSNDERARLVSAAKGRTADFSIGPIEIRRMLYRLGRPRTIDRLLLAWAASQRDIGDPDALKAIGHAKSEAIPNLPFRGADIVERGVSPGPKIGAIMREFEAWWIDCEFPQDKDRLERKLTELIAAQNG